MIRSLICAASLGLALPGWASPAPAHPTAGPAAVAVEVATQEVTYTAGDTTLKGYLAWPKGQTGRPGVLVVHEWWGHNAYLCIPRYHWKLAQGSMTISRILP